MVGKEKERVGERKSQRSVKFQRGWKFLKQRTLLSFKYLILI